MRSCLPHATAFALQATAHRMITQAPRIRPCWSWLCALVGLTLAVGGMATPVQAQTAGAGSFARIGFGARGIAMGNALTASSADDLSPYYNPALAPSASGQRITASAALLAFDRELQFLEFTTPIGPTAGIGVGVIHAGVSNIDGRDINGVRTGLLSTDEFAFLLSFGNRFADRLSVGATLKLYQADYAEAVGEVRSFGLDLGTRVEVTEQVHVGVSVSDLLAKYEFGQSGGGRTNTDYFPTRLRAGAEVRLLDGRLALTGEYESRFTRRDERIRTPVPTTRGPRTQTQTETRVLHDSQGRLGAAYQIIDILELRAGVDRLGGGDVEALRPSAGFGLDEEIGNLSVRVGYAVVLESYTRNAMSLFTLSIFI